MLLETVVDNLPGDWRSNPNGINTVQQYVSNDTDTEHVVDIDSIVNETNDVNVPEHIGGPSRNNTAPINPDAEPPRVTVAEHDSGARLHIALIADTWIVEAVQTLTHGALRLLPTTHTGTFDTESDALEYLQTVAAGIDAGDDTYETISVITHDGDIDSINTDALKADGQYMSVSDDSIEHELADIIAIRSGALNASPVSLSSLRANRTRFTQSLYGLGTRAPDGTEIVADETTEETVHLPLEVFSVTADSIDIRTTDNNQ